MSNIVAIIPARCGSTRFPGKNIYPLCEKPLISYPIEAALKARGITRVIVSTDCKEVAEVALSFGAEVPFMRPAYLADAKSNVVDALMHAVKWLEEHEEYHVDYTVLLQPTTPVISLDHIESAIDIISRNKGVDSVISATKLDTPSNPYNIRIQNSDEFLEFWQGETHYLPAARNHNVYFKAANMWVSSYKTLMETKRLEGERNRFIEVEWEYALDIDYPHDLQLLEAWLLYKKNKKIR